MTLQCLYGTNEHRKLPKTKLVCLSGPVAELKHDLLVSPQFIPVLPAHFFPFIDTADSESSYVLLVPLNACWWLQTLPFEMWSCGSIAGSESSFQSLAGLMRFLEVRLGFW